MPKNLIISLVILTLIIIMSVSLLGRKNNSIIPVITTITSNDPIVKNNIRETITKIQKDSSFDCTTFTSIPDKKYCGEDIKIINETLLSGDIQKCEKLSNVPRKESCKEQIITRKAAKSGKSSDCDMLSSTGSRESCRANMSYWKVVENTIIAQ